MVVVVVVVMMMMMDFDAYVFHAILSNATINPYCFPLPVAYV